MITKSVRIPLPWAKPPLTANQRLHYMQRARLVAHVRWVVLSFCRSRQLPTGLDHITVRLCYTPPDRRRRDADNIVPTMKAACDALAAGTTKHPGYGMVPDDTPKWMTKYMPVITSPEKGLGPTERLWLTVEWDEHDTEDDARADD